MDFLPRLPKKGKRINEDKREVVRVLLETGRSYRDVADTLEISIGSVHNIMKEPAGLTAGFVAALKARFAQKHYMLSDHILTRITDGDIRGASLKDKVIAAAILADKARSLEKSAPCPGKSPGCIELERIRQAEEIERVEFERAERAPQAQAGENTADSSCGP